MFMAVPAALILLAAYAAARASYTSDEELTARFLSRESDFQALVHRLDSDRGRLPPGTESVDLADLVQVGADRARVGDYEALLTRIGATNFRYFPASGNLIVLVSNPGDPRATTRKSYSYLGREEPQPLLHPGAYASHAPGVYFAPADHRIKGRWFVHRDGPVVGAFAPY